MRKVEIRRKTNETEVSLSLNLDGNGRIDINTGIGFFDHMLGQFAMHSLFDLKMLATGDLHVDVHHTIEDCALILGQAIDQALGDRKGIHRMGSAYVPMDEALAFVALDLSGRPYVVVQVEWRGVDVGGVPTSLFHHFLETLAFSARINLHARLLYGRDDHHKTEALFKALGRAFTESVRIDPRRKDAVPSTKGSLV